MPLKFPHDVRTLLGVTADTFKPELTEALKAYEKYIICLEKTPEECKASLRSLMDKAIKAYESRGPQLRHGIALDRYTTIILSQSDNERPFCAVYFNLHSPYHKRAAQRAAIGQESAKGASGGHKGAE